MKADSLRDRVIKWGGVVLTCQILKESRNQPLVTVIKIKNKKGTHTLVLDGFVQTHDNLLATGLKVVIFEYFGRVLEVKSRETGMTYWESEWDLDNSHIGYNAYHQCESGGCTHWSHFYEMTPKARDLFATLNKLSGHNDFGRIYWHPEVLWSGKDYWECAAAQNHLVVCLDTNEHFGLCLVLPGLTNLKIFWQVYISKNGTDQEFISWLSSLKFAGVYNLCKRFSANGVGDTLFHVLQARGLMPE